VKPVVSRLEAEFGDRVEFRQLNIDDRRNDAAKRQYRFRAQPQVVIVNTQGEIVFSRLSELTYRKLSTELAIVLGEARIMPAIEQIDVDREE
jgi:hypothetical protein